MTALSGIYSPVLNVWNGFVPGEDGLWEFTPEEMARWYPEIINPEVTE